MISPCRVGIINLYRCDSFDTVRSHRGVGGLILFDGPYAWDESSEPDGLRVIGDRLGVVGGVLMIKCR